MLGWQVSPRGLECSEMAKKESPPQSIGSLMVAARYAKMTPEERSAAAKNAAEKRWAKEKKEKKKAGSKKKAKGVK